MCMSDGESIFEVLSLRMVTLRRKTEKIESSILVGSPMKHPNSESLAESERKSILKLSTLVFWLRGTRIQKGLELKLCF